MDNIQRKQVYFYGTLRSLQKVKKILSDAYIVAKAASISMWQGRTMPNPKLRNQTFSVKAVQTAALRLPR